MRFSRVKLPQIELPKLRKVSAELVRPYEWMAAPVYVHLELNDKFIAVKAPLQFFSPAELDRLKGYREFYFPNFVDAVVPFQRGGEATRTLLGLREVHNVNTSAGVEEVPVPLSSTEISDAILRIIGTLWGAGGRLEPFFLAFFASEVCDPVARETLAQAVDQDIERLELGLLRSSLAVFLGLHIGFGEVKLLNSIRNRVLSEAMAGVAASDDSRATNEIAQLAELVARLVPNVDTREVTIASLTDQPGRVAAKLRSRLMRVKEEFIREEIPVPSLYGDGGIRDDE